MEVVGYTTVTYLVQCQCILRLVHSVSQAGRRVQIIVKQNHFFYIWNCFQMWNMIFFFVLTTMKPLKWFSLFLLIFDPLHWFRSNFIWRNTKKSYKLCECPHHRKRVHLMSAAVSAPSLLMPRRVIEKWCGAGHVLQAETGRECNHRHKCIWNSSPTSFFYITVLVHSFVGKRLACNLTAVLCTQEGLTGNKNHQVGRYND